MLRIKKITNQLRPISTSSDKEEEEFLGIHTCIPSLLGLPYVHKFLHGNYKLPPYVIATGNGERVRDSLKYLDEGVLLQDVMRSFNLNPFRIEIAVGLYKGTPIMIFEHQIGAGSTEIYLKELLSNKCMTNIYKVSSTNKIFTSDSKYLIRLGTSLGINNESKSNDIEYKPGDISVSTHQVGISSTDFQAITSNLNIFNAKSSINDAQDLLNKMGYKMAKSIPNSDEIWPVVLFDKQVHDTLTQCVTDNYECIANKNKYKCISSLGNVSKDSLYSEKAPRTFTKLRKYLNVGTSDMEAATIIRTTKQMTYEFNNNIKVGFCSIILGVLSPDGGDSFVSFDRRLSSDVQWTSAFDALHKISQTHIN